MNFVKSEPLRQTRIEPRPEVAAFYSRVERISDSGASALIILAILYFAAQFGRAYFAGLL